MQAVSFPSVNGLKLAIEQEGLDSIGGVAWDCGRSLVHLLLEEEFQQRIKDFFPTKSQREVKVVELGSGTGLVGLQMAALGYYVILTDRGIFQSLLRRNTAKNSAVVGDRVTIDTLDWDSELDKDYLPADLILASDCVYDWKTCETLPQCLEQSVGESTLVIFAFENREEELRERLFQKISKFLDFENIPQSPGYQCEDVEVMLLRRKMPKTSQFHL